MVALAPPPAEGQSPARDAEPSPLLRVARAVASHRLVQFAVLGALLFALGARSPAPTEIRISRADLELERDQYARRRNVPALSASEARDIESRWIEDAVLAREAVRLGLDADDPIVRERLIQKVLFLAEDLGGASRAPTDKDLRAFFEARRDSYTVEARVHFVHVLAVSNDAAEALRVNAEAYRPSASDADPAPPLGESLPIRRNVVATVSEVASLYGADFASAVAALPVGGWSPPIRSKYGAHLVWVLSHAATRPAEFEDAKSALRLDYLRAERETSVRRYLERAFERYRVYVDGERVTELHGAARTAPRTSLSGED